MLIYANVAPQNKLAVSCRCLLLDSTWEAMIKKTTQKILDLIFAIIY